ncbi:MFS transporter [Chloroflexi bacterium TSY]|nr:MFS transporter [Chloroflexi bacterium TSY]
MDTQTVGTGKWVLVLSIILPLAFVEMLWKGGTQGPTNFFNIFLDADLQVSPERIGLLLGVSQLAAAGLALTTPWLAHRIGHGLIIVLAFVGLIVGLLIMAGSTNWPGASVGYMLFQALAAISTSAIAVYRMEKVDAIWWGWTSGIAVAAQGFGESSIFFGGGILIEQYGFSSFFRTTAAVLAVGLIFFIFYFRPLDRTNLVHKGKFQ